MYWGMSNPTMSWKDGPVPRIPVEIPIYFLSHKLTSTQQMWPVMVKEAYVIVYAP